MAGPSRVLITGIDGFTGKHLAAELEGFGYDCVGIQSDLLNKNSLHDEILSLKPDFVVHLAGISFSAELDSGKLYDVNVVGSENLFEALIRLKVTPKKVIIASSAAVYGNKEGSAIDEKLTPSPISHYGCSKLSMELMTKNYEKKLPIIIARPFNYTGVGHHEKFVVPKIVKAFQAKKKNIELGNLDIYREFNDVRDICTIYRKLITSPANSGIVNLCSGQKYNLMDIINTLKKISDHEINVNTNDEYVRLNEIKTLSGSTSNLSSFISLSFQYSLSDTLEWMYDS